MIQANELRIGNYIMYVEGDMGKVVGINDHGYIAISCDREYFGQSDYDPIPITPEILEKCGFAKSQMGYEFEGIELELFFGKLKYKYGNEIRLRTHIQYVHQLQNLYHILCGTELTVQL